MEDRGLATCLSCCECGIPITYNATSMCETCLRSMVDITQSLSKRIDIEHCFQCSRYLNPPSSWISGNDSKELLHVCLKLIRGLSKYDVKDAKFLWTEPHSKRIKVQLVLQQAIDVTATVRGIGGGAAVEQTTVIEYVMRSHICENCTRDAAKDYWNASVQVRQKVAHKKTLYYMEQIILKFNAHKDCLNIKKVSGGVDFFFSNRSNALGFVHFIQNKLPVHYTESKKLKSHDDKSNTFNYKYTYCIEIPPVCKDDLVCLPKGFAQKLGNFSQICIVSKITSEIHLIDPLSGQTRRISSNVYFSNPFGVIASSRNLAEFLVVDTELCPPTKLKPGDCTPSIKHAMADIYAYRMNEMNDVNDQIHVRTHLGNIIQAGHTVMGVDMRSLNTNNEEMDKIDEDKIPDVIFIKRYYDRNARKSARRWKLHRLGEDGESITTANNEEQDEFLEDIEEDAEIRANINIYKREEDDGLVKDEFGDIPTVPLEEMLSNVNLSYNPTIMGDDQEDNDDQMEM